MSNLTNQCSLTSKVAAMLYRKVRVPSLGSILATRAEINRTFGHIKSENRHLLNIKFFVCRTVVLKQYHLCVYVLVWWYWAFALLWLPTAFTLLSLQITLTDRWQNHKISVLTLFRVWYLEATIGILGWHGGTVFLSQFCVLLPNNCTRWINSL